MRTSASRRGRRSKKLRLTVLRPVGIRPNGGAWRDYVRGEWWIDRTGQSEFADMDVGEAGHERIAVENMLDRDALVEGLAGWYRSKEPLKNGWGRDEANDKASEIQDAESAADIFFTEFVPDSVGAKAAGSLQRWRDLKTDARLAYAKHEGAILAINKNFFAYRVTEETIAAIQSFIEELVSEGGEDDPIDGSADICVEQGEPTKYACLPADEFMLIRKPKELWR